MAVMSASMVNQLPDSLLVEIFSHASGIQQRQQDEGKPFLGSTLKQQRYLCGIFALVTRRWRQVALSMCETLEFCLTDSSNTDLVTSWLKRNGSNVQHLRLRCRDNRLPILSTLHTSTPQLV
jgi:hypothetical protein